MIWVCFPPNIHKFTHLDPRREIFNENNPLSRLKEIAKLGLKSIFLKFAYFLLLKYSSLSSIRKIRTKKYYLFVKQNILIKYLRRLIFAMSNLFFLQFIFLHLSLLRTKVIVYQFLSKFSSFNRFQIFINLTRIIGDDLECAQNIVNNFW